MFLGCQKIDYHAKHCNIEPRKKGFRKTLQSLERPVHVVAERELIAQNCEWRKKNEEEEEEEEKKKKEEEKKKEKKKKKKNKKKNLHCFRFLLLVNSDLLLTLWHNSP